MKRLPIVLAISAVALGAGCRNEAALEPPADSPAPPPAAAPLAEAVPAQVPPAQVPPAAPPPVASAPPVAQAPQAPPVAQAPPPPPAVAPPAEAAAPALTSSPAPEPRVLIAGTPLSLVLQTTVASNTSQVGDRVLATLAEDAVVEGRVILVAGTEVMGRVTLAQQSGRVKGRARLVMEFDEVRDGGAAYRIEATPVDVTAGSSKGKDAKIAGGAAAAGALIGAITGGGKGALKGGAIGGAAGGAAVLATRGEEVTLEAGTALQVKLTHPIQID